jgi:hypothetical protein
MPIKEHEFKYILLPEKPRNQQSKQPSILTSYKRKYKLSLNHPWEKSILPLWDDISPVARVTIMSIMQSLSSLCLERERLFRSSIEPFSMPH